LARSDLWSQGYVPGIEQLEEDRQLEVKRLAVRKEINLPLARIQIAEFNTLAPAENIFTVGDVFWMDICLTPRRPKDCARYVDHWAAHRFASLGPIIALPPAKTLCMRSVGGRRTSLICQLNAAAVQRWLGGNFRFTDRALEVCLDIANASIRSLLLRLAAELHRPGVASIELAESITLQLSIELARHLAAVSSRVETGGLAAWRLRIIEKRLATSGPPPSLSELGVLCKLSSRQLTRAFRMSRGCSVADYMTQTRIEAAKRRLATPESIKEISMSMGFSSQSTFTYAFRRATGLTPNQFRALILRGGERIAERA
jgi:AraC family transcriptional regulator